MAKVMISNELRDKILNNVTAKYNEMIEKKRSEFIETHKQALYRCAVSEENEKKALELPTDLVHYSSCLYFKRNDHRYDIPLGYARPVPSPLQYSYNNDPFLIKDPDLHNAFCVMEDEVKALQEKVSKLNKDVKKVLTTCKTLKQVIEVWPSVLEFCPDTVKTRHVAPDPPRYKKGDVTLAEDTKLELVKVRML